MWRRRENPLRKLWPWIRNRWTRCAVWPRSRWSGRIFEQAYELQSKLIGLGQRGPELFYNTGLLLQKSGHLEDAVKLYRQALNEKPNIAEALLNLGHALKALGQDDEARTCWRKALESNPELASSYFTS